MVGEGGSEGGPFPWHLGFNDSTTPIFFRGVGLSHIVIFIRPSQFIPNPEKISLGPFEKLF